MIPYIHVPDFHIGPAVHLFGHEIGPMPIHPFGLLVLTGVLVGTSITMRLARRRGMDLEELNSFITWMLVAAFVISHVFDSFFYHWDKVKSDPLSVLKIWDGLSSFGGFIGAVVGIVLWKYFLLDEHFRPYRRASPAPLLPYADLVLSVFPVGWIFGRAGCSTVHDHLGASARADALLAVARERLVDLQHFPMGASDPSYTFDLCRDPVATCAAHFSRSVCASLASDECTRVGFIQLWHGKDYCYDLGLLELFFTLFLAGCFALTWRRRLPVGSYVIAACLAYAPVRFAMDFLRLPDDEGGDSRYLGLTPAQYGCMLLFVYGLAMIFYVRRLRQPAGGPPAPASDAPHEDVGEGGTVNP